MLTWSQIEVTDPLKIVVAIALLLVACSPEPPPDVQAEVREVWAAFHSARMRGDAQGQLDLLASTVNTCAELRQLSLEATAAELATRPPIERVAVCAIRRELDSAEIEASGCRSLWLRLMNDQELTIDDMPAPPAPELERFRQVNETRVTARFDALHGEPTILFYAEDGAWRIDLTSVARAINDELEGMERRSGQTIEEIAQELADAFSFGVDAADPDACELRAPTQAPP